MTLARDYWYKLHSSHNATSFRLLIFILFVNLWRHIKNAMTACFSVRKRYDCALSWKQNAKMQLKYAWIEERYYSKSCERIETVQRFYLVYLTSSCCVYSVRGHRCRFLQFRNRRLLTVFLLAHTHRPCKNRTVSQVKTDPNLRYFMLQAFWNLILSLMDSLHYFNCIYYKILLCDTA